LNCIRILADENIIGLAEAFACFEGLDFELRLKAGRDICHGDLHDVDALLVRSVTSVNESLIGDSSLSFVGTATSGVNHIDQSYLKRKGITFYSAAGAHAIAVAEYVIASLALLSKENDCQYLEKKIGIVGHGHVGKALQERLQALGVEPVIYDPFLERKEPERSGQEDDLGGYSPWSEIKTCEVVSFHVPFTKGGEFPTQKMMNADFFAALPEGAVLLNAARGEICDERALIDSLAQKVAHCVIDVWENEPDISKTLLQAASLSTAHIAGYSYEGKVRATYLLIKALSEHYDLAKIGRETQDENEALESDEFELEELKKVRRALFNQEEKLMPWQGDIKEIIINAYCPSYDSDALKSKPANASLAEHFDCLRKNYSHRKEWGNYRISGVNSETARKQLEGLGFLVEMPLEGDS
jgi:erythronate-4-phosphate dehydrogenase